MPELPIACSLTPDALRARRQGLLPGLVQRAERREELAEGLAAFFEIKSAAASLSGSG